MLFRRSNKAVPAALLATAVLLVSACGTPDAVSQESTTEPPSASESEATTEAATPSEEATTEAPEFPNRHPNYMTPVDAAFTLPDKWSGKGGWTETGVTGYVALEEGVAYLMMNGTYGVIGVYDKNGELVNSSELPEELAPENPDEPVIHTITHKGKEYLMLYQSGQLKPREGDTKAAGNGMVITLFDGKTGEILNRARYEVPQLKDRYKFRGDAFSIYDVGNTPGYSYVFNPETMNFDEVPDLNSTYNHSGENWELRVDGVDIYANVSENSFDPHTITNGEWSYQGRLADNASVGKYLGIFLREGSSYDCIVIDVHTGEKVPAFEGVEGCFADIRNDFYEGVVMMASQDPSSFQQTIVNVEDGTNYPFSQEDTFVPEFVGADGVVYGVSSPVRGEEIPSYYDPSSGEEPRTMGDADTAMPSAVSGDGIGLFFNATNAVLVTSEDEG